VPEGPVIEQSLHQHSEQSAAIIREQAGHAPLDVGLVPGGSLAAIADQISTPTIIPYAKLPGFIEPKSGVAELDRLPTGRRQNRAIRGVDLIV
jgi:hypothetical protein